MSFAQIWFVVLLLLSCNISAAREQGEWIADQLGKSSPTSCEEGSHVLNRCEERCECRDGKLINSYRVRKEFTKMDIKQRRRFIKTYKMASVHPAFKKDYEKLVAYHINAPDELLHNTPHIFFPWHRWFLVQFENLLRRIDCRVTIPYWDWSRVAHQWWNGSGIVSSVEIWSSGDHGLGGDGKQSDYDCVEDGPFSKHKWRLLKIAGGGCLKRIFYYVSLTGDTKHLNKTLALPLEKFFEFEEIVRLAYHSEVHNFINGTMYSSSSSANAPEVVLHHSFLDKIWLQWQKKGDDYKNVYFPSVRYKLPKSKYYGWQWLDSDNLPGQVKVMYED